MGPCVHPGRGLDSSALLGHSLGVRHALCVSRLAQTASQGIRAVFGIDPRTAPLKPLPSLRDREQQRIVQACTGGGDWQASFLAVATDLEAVSKTRSPVACYDCSSWFDDLFRGVWLSDWDMMVRRPLECESFQVA